MLFDGWTSFFPEKVAVWRKGLATTLRERLETRVAPKYIASQRWYAGKGSAISRARLGDHGELETSHGRWLAGVFEVESDGTCTRYFLPFAIAYEDTDEGRWQKLQAGAFARVRRQATVGVLADATSDENFCRSVVEAMGAGAEIRTEGGQVKLNSTSVFAQLRGDPAAPLAITPLSSQSSNTTVRVGDSFFLKFYRRLQSGINPELEIGRYLTEQVKFPNIVPVAGAAEYRSADGTPVTLALLQAFVANQGDGWDYTVNYLTRFLEERDSAAGNQREIHGGNLELIRTLGIRTAELHRALATPTADPAFAPEPITTADVTGWRAHVRAEASQTLDLLSERVSQLPEPLLADANTVLSRRELLLQHIDGLTPKAPVGLKIRHHGDYHLGQVLLKRNDFVIVDFEGEPARPLQERREKHSPLRDVAGMLRSFTYARRAAIRQRDGRSADDTNQLESLLDQWESEARRAFVKAYDGIAQSAGLYRSWQEALPLLSLFEAEKSLYELRYELGNRPDWAGIPLRSLLALTQ